MKFWFLTCLVVPLFFVACGDKSNNTTAPAPAPTCINGTTYCDSSQYGYAQGFSAYPKNPYYYPVPEVNGGAYSTANYGNFCDCPVGQRPVYNGQYGLGCVSAAAFQPYAGSAQYWAYEANNNQWVNPPQVSNTQGYYGNKDSSCYRNVAQTCLVDQPNSCGGGAICQTTAGGSRVGICTTQTSQPFSPNAANRLSTQPNGSGYR